MATTITSHHQLAKDFSQATFGVNFLKATTQERFPLLSDAASA
ncbi:hypothetical protein COLO4_34267 [Corchorus olitorius]|uniref:Uncharacterized protein n=1 Tax=Corchorus olitorius TaxID=93759 RepID=A0A1R3GMB8_9ROSI|nr:hypothetical protein COLO4_34267 [Corchorus olitorius]